MDDLEDRSLKAARHLTLARRHFTEGMARFERQRVLVTQLRLHGHEASAAAGQRLLDVFEQSLNLMLAHLEMEETELKSRRARSRSTKGRHILQ